MKKTEHKITIIEYDSADDLPKEDQKLLVMAKEAACNAYAPYSGFHVGAAIILESGIFVKGSNQENAAYPSGLCAERVAAFAASSQYPGVRFKAIAITAYSDNFEVTSPVTPCGSCRQVLAEYEHLQKTPIKMILSGEKGKVILIGKVEDLLPVSFNADGLKKK